MIELHACPFMKALRRFSGDRSGVAAVEFAFIAPLLMLMTFGTFEITRALIMHQRFQKATALIGDLVAREQQLGANPGAAYTQLFNMMKAPIMAIAPYSSEPLQLAIYQFRASSTNPALTRIEWSFGHNMAPDSCTTDYRSNSKVPANLLSKGDAAIIIDAKYQYTPLLANLLPKVIKTMTWTDRMTFAPRYGSVFYGQNTQNSSC